MWKPREIIVHEEVRDDEVTKRIIDSCHGVPVLFTKSGLANDIVKKSRILRKVRGGMVEKIMAGKRVLANTTELIGGEANSLPNIGSLFAQSDGAAMKRTRGK